ncbi:MAG: hypothetical protein J6S74_02210 [Alphaproteobacteria bacterium]|nr:hypothetical protein [Alphaproteobacteria bacterium]
MNDTQYKKKLARWAATLGLSGFTLVLLAVGTDDARDFANTHQGTNLTPASQKTTLVMEGAGTALMIGAIALLRKREKIK